MKINKAEIVISAVDPKQYPTDNLPEIVLIGRSNVGKSSFINSMINRKSLARTSSQPGKTQTINFYKINDSFYFVDMPGYGYAKASKEERLKWGKMIEYYLLNRKNLALVIQVIDFRHLPSENDLLMYNWLEYYNIKPLIVTTKIDKIKRSQYKKNLTNIKKAFNNNANIIPFSSQEKNGVDLTWHNIGNYITI